MSSHRSFGSLGLLLLLISASQQLTSKAIAASPATLADASASSILPQGKNGAALVTQLIKHVNNMGCYKFDASQEALIGTKVLKATGTFYFKPVSAMRVEVKDYGSKSGSTLIKSPEGDIKGKGGPQMFGMKMKLATDSRLLRMPNGLSAVECDLGSLVKRRLEREQASGCKMVSSGEPMSVEGIRAIVLESQTSDDSVVDRVFIDPASKLPAQWDLFENGKFQSRSKFQNYQTNVEIDDSQFKL